MYYDVYANHLEVCVGHYLLQFVLWSQYVNELCVKNSTSSDTPSW
jgi:hypothetical protein